MKDIHIQLDQHAYDVRIGSGLLNDVSTWVRPLFKGQKIMVFSDLILAPLYLKCVIDQLRGAGYEVYSHIFPNGEAQKNIKNAERAYRILFQMRFTRSDLLISLGGGVIGDLVGFVAATYMRGMSFVQIPTTLLAQVDASVGGKTAINTDWGKNIVGAFHQPAGVLIDVDVLKSLKPIHISEGMAEVIKYGLICDSSLLDLVCADVIDWVDLIARCVSIKGQVVEMDEQDHGQRMILNFGHTLGHAIELATGYAMYTHGAAVACGMVAICRIGEYMGLTPHAVRRRLETCLKKWQLDLNPAVELEAVLSMIRADKKWTGDHLNLVVLKDFGQPIILQMTLEEMIHAVTKTWVQAGLNDESNRSNESDESTK